MIEKRPSDISTYSLLLGNSIHSITNDLQRISSTIKTFEDFGNLDKDTSLVVLKMIALTASELNDELKSAAVSLTVLKDHKVSRREVAVAAQVTPTTLKNWVDESEIPSYWNEDEQ